MERKNVYKLLIDPNGQSLFDAILKSENVDRNCTLFEKLLKNHQRENPSFNLAQVKLEKKHNRLVPKGSPLLYFAAAVGSIPIIKLLLENEEIKETVNHKMTFSIMQGVVNVKHIETPLSVAIYDNHFEVAKALIIAGAKFYPDNDYYHVPIGHNNHSLEDRKQYEKTSALINLYRYRADIGREMDSFFYKEITCKLKDSFSFFRGNSTYDKTVKSELANLLTDIFEGKKEVNALNDLTDKQKAHLEDGRLKAVYDQILTQELIPNPVCQDSPIKNND